MKVLKENPQLIKLLKPKLNSYIPHKPSPKQTAFLLLQCLDAFYGGAVAGGKSDALLMDALQNVHVPGYAAIIFRDSYSNLNEPDALIPRSHEWLTGTNAVWRAKENTWHFPSGATLGFGYLNSPLDHYHYQSAAFQYIGFDEVQQLRENQVLYMFSRLRRKKGTPVPLKFRSAGNPPTREQTARVGNWVKGRYIDSDTRGDRVFISARLEDNPFIDGHEYEKALNQLDPITRKQLREGDWDIHARGFMFDRSWFEIVDHYPHDSKHVRWWDLAATPDKGSNDPDRTCGARLTVKDGIIYIVDIQKIMATPGKVETFIKNTTELDSRRVTQWMEQEPGSAGKAVCHHYQSKVIPGYPFYFETSTGPKTEYAAPLSSQAEAGNVKIVRASWNKDFFDEIVLFPSGAHDDQVDAVSKAYDKLVRRKRCGIW